MMVYLKLVLGWLIDTQKLTLALPKHQIAHHINEILDSIPPSQKLKKWHKVLLANFYLSLLLCPVRRVCCLFSQMQLALYIYLKHRIKLSKVDQTQPWKTFVTCTRILQINQHAID